jgi:hypothetical protein
VRHHRPPATGAESARYWPAKRSSVDRTGSAVRLASVLPVASVHSRRSLRSTSRVALSIASLTSGSRTQYAPCPPACSRRIRPSTQRALNRRRRSRRLRRRLLLRGSRGRRAHWHWRWRRHRRRRAQLLLHLFTCRSCASAEVCR